MINIDTPVTSISVFNQFSQREVRLSVSNIFFIRREDAAKLFADYTEDEGGRCDAAGVIYLYWDADVTESQVAHFAAHELAHLYGFNRYRVKDENGTTQSIKRPRGHEHW